MSVLKPDTRSILEECIEHAIRVRLDYTGCVGRALHVLNAVDPRASAIEAWRLTEDVMTDTLGRSASERFASLATRH